MKLNLTQELNCEICELDMSTGTRLTRSRTEIGKTLLFRFSVTDHGLTTSSRRTQSRGFSGPVRFTTWLDRTTNAVRWNILLQCPYWSKHLGAPHHASCNKPRHASTNDAWRCCCRCTLVVCITTTRKNNVQKENEVLSLNEQRSSNLCLTNILQQKAHSGHRLVHCQDSRWFGVLL